MKRKINISASYTGVLPIAEYSNARPGFSASEEFEIEYSEPKELDFIIEHRQRAMMAICLENYNQEANRARIQKITNDRKDFHFYELENGEEVPSVTSILNYDTDFLVDENELKQYAAQGNIIHAQVSEFIKTGLWKSPKDIEGTTADLFILKSGSLSLSLDGWDFPAFLKKYPMEKLENGDIVLNEKERYGGLPDGYGTIGGVYSIFDIKRTPEKTKNFMQMAAYSKAQKKEIKQMIIIPLNDKTEQGFSKPIISTEIDKYFELFLYKRREFKKVYGI